MRQSVLNHEECGNRDGPDEPVRRSGNVVLDGLALSFSRRLLDPVWLGGPSVNQSCEANLHNSAVGEINRKAVATYPHEQLVREHVLERRRQPDTGDNKIPANRGETLWVACRALGDEVVSNPFELPRPGCPLPVLSRVARNVPSEDDEGSQYGPANPRVIVDEITEPLL
jgi:hypothetical protein